MRARKAEVKTYQAANQEEMQRLKEMPEEAVARTIRNWESQMICIQHIILKKAVIHIIDRDQDIIL